jgi:hypothetical protein
MGGTSMYTALPARLSATPFIMKSMVFHHVRIEALGDQTMTEGNSLVPAERIERAILSVRGFRVMLDSDLAEIYGVKTKVLNQAVKRNPDRFPEDFMFRLTSEETGRLRSQSVTSKTGRGGRRYLPFVFTEHGALMLANVLNSPGAVKASVLVVRAFLRLRRLLETHEELARKVAELERKYDSQFLVLFDAVRRLMAPPAKARPRIGFRR